MNDSHVKAREMQVMVPQSRVGEMQVTGNPIKMSDYPVQYVKGSPDLGEDNDEVFGGLGFMPEQLAQFRADGVIGLGMKNLVFVISASEEHNLRNSNKSTAACLADFEKMAAAYAGAGLNITLAIACTFGSSFGDTITPDDVLRIYEVAARYGIRRAGLANSAGVSVPSHTRAMPRAHPGDRRGEHLRPLPRYPRHGPCKRLRRHGGGHQPLRKLARRQAPGAEPAEQSRL